MEARDQALHRLAAIIDRLRAECPWDRQQTLESMIPCVQEETAELADAVAARAPEAVREELGDLLMNVFLMSRIGEESRSLSLEQVAHDIAEKLVRRHPHVFGAHKAANAQEALQNWDRVKRSEAGYRRRSLLDGLPSEVSALRRAAKMVGKAASVGFDWPDAQGALDKVEEELREVRGALDQGPARVEAELGDLLFAAVCASRLARVDPEVALRRACQRFEQRFRYVEAALGERMGKAGLDEMESLWQEAKRKES
jgi:MazG family protein